MTLILFSFASLTMYGMVYYRKVEKNMYEYTVGIYEYIRLSTFIKVPVGMHVFHISSIVLVPWFSCLGGYLSVPDDYPLVLGCEKHVSSSCLHSLVVRALER